LSPGAEQAHGTGAVGLFVVCRACRYRNGALYASYTVELTVQGLDRSPERARLTHHRIDGEHGNADAAWQKMGAPGEPAAEQRAALRKASGLTLWEDPKAVAVRDRRVVQRFPMPRQSVSLLVPEW
jgi:xylan 1,4-beta-xylosidase